MALAGAGLSGGPTAPLACDGCDRWFHSDCAGYPPLLPDPERNNGHTIALHAYCRECLADMELDHATVLGQQDEYARLDGFFRDHAHRWRWVPVEQNGRCCLEGVYNKLQPLLEEFPTFESFIAACAQAAIQELDGAQAETKANKRAFGATYRKLLKAPESLADLWREVEVQYLWLGLAKRVLRHVLLQLFELECKEGGVPQLRCIQKYPEEERETVVRLLQWNRSVAEHFDLLEAVEMEPLRVVVKLHKSATTADGGRGNGRRSARRCRGRCV